MSQFGNIAEDTASGAAAGSIVPGIGTIIGGTLGLAEGVIGLVNSDKAAKEAKSLASTRPQYQIDPLTNQDLALTESDLASGATAGERAAQQLDNEQFSTATGAALKAGATPNDIGSIYGNSLDGRLRLSQMRDQIRLNQISNYIKASQAKQDADQTQWDVNKFGPWQDAAQANAEARQGAAKQTNTGANTFGSAAQYFANQLQDQKRLTVPEYLPSIPTSAYSTNTPTTSSPNYFNPNTVLPEQVPAYQSQDLTDFTNFDE